jgi:hypothetical protein
MQRPPTPAAVGHEWPGSTRLQSAEQPSPATVLPSSQLSSPTTLESPHTIVDAHLIPGTLHSKNISSRHAPEQPSPGAMFPSSHCSVPLSRPSPQYSSRAQGRPGMAQV